MIKKNILIVDDSEFDRKLLNKALKRNDQYNVLEAKTAKHCYELLDKEKIDLILLDIIMPGTYGTEVLLKIREKHNQLTMPIIMVTSKGDHADIVGCLLSGANDYITKPVNFEVAITRIKTHIALSELASSMSRLSEFAALDALITTYNHEINNPLAIAIGCLNASDIKATSNYQKLEKALWRIAEIMKSIREITEKKEVEFKDYLEGSKIIKVK